MRECWQPNIFDRLEPKQLPKSVRLACASLSVATSLTLAACGPTPKPSPEVQQPGSSPVLATKIELTPALPTVPAAKLAPSPAPTREAPKPTVKAATTEKAPEPGFTRHRSTVNPYQIDYPDGWRIIYEETAGKKIETFLDPTDSLNFNLQVFTEKINPWVTLDDYEKKWVNEKYRAGSNFAVVATSSDQFVPKGIDGKDVWIINTSGSYSGIKALVFIHNDLGWLFQFVYRTSDGIERLPLVDQMIASIIFRQ